MLTLIHTFWALCLLRLGPEDLPASDFLLYLMLGLHAVAVVLISLAVYPLGTALLAGITGTLVLAGLTLAVLQIHKLAGRFHQTLTALAGSGALLTFIALVPNWWFYAARESGAGWGTPTLLLFLILIWSVVVTAHILRRALSTHFFLGLVIAVVFYWVSAQIHASLFPVPA
ncbi:MAG: hypothetical protein U5S82_05415 [Gammaproteobacteria bacterium]|nr:hypothetical protein [Gammaproteobacteria bacterium]